ncbi:hypothetical protein AKJ09_00730 [Labilithrix luteola]|uniref:Uncharacterized protein n=1 Tax=Labilithrix luteola TaxID=1391654 RepID=A0A0K1PKY6_9BACT|nr:hypothetical protein AKJ09_00730 [Labilithrix luteola]
MYPNNRSRRCSFEVVNVVERPAKSMSDDERRTFGKYLPEPRLRRRDFLETLTVEQRRT